MVVATFYFKKPKKPISFVPCTKGADLDKLARGLGDALTGYAYFDDCQIVTWVVQKGYVDSEEEEGVVFDVVEFNHTVITKGLFNDSEKDKY
jgi:Holliday junction resolvase RusA-like endonuclease